MERNKVKWVVKFVQKWNSNPATIRLKRVNSILSFYHGLLVFRIVRSPRRSLTHSTKHSSFFHSPFIVLIVAIFLLYSFFSYSSYSSFSTCIILYGFLVASFCMSRGSNITSENELERMKFIWLNYLKFTRMKLIFQEK